MIDRFSKTEFENALPVHKLTGVKLWEEMEFDNEYVYRMRVGGNVYIIIRSSVDSSGYAADSWNNSIRCWLVDVSRNPLGNKIQSYVTRVPGWSVRLKKMLTEYWKMGQTIVQPCVVCGSQKHVFICKRGKPENIGRRFTKCSSGCGDMVWIDPPKNVKSEVAA